MKSFRGEKQKHNPSMQVVLALLALLTTILLVNIIPHKANSTSSKTQKTIWESSVIQLP